MICALQTALDSEAYCAIFVMLAILFSQRLIASCSGERVSLLLADWQRHQRSADDEPERSLQSHQQTFWPVQEAGGAEGGEQEELHGEGGDPNIVKNNHRHVQSGVH